WLKIPGTPISFQPSSFAYLLLVIYLCRYLTIKIKRERHTWENILLVFGPVLVVFGLVAKDNGSTALMILIVSLAVMLIGQLNKKYILGFCGLAAAAIGIFMFLALKTDIIENNRVHTWMSRIEVFFDSKQENQIENEIDKAKNYQVMQAKAAIVHG